MTDCHWPHCTSSLPDSGSGEETAERLRITKPVSFWWIHRHHKHALVSVANVNASGCLERIVSSTTLCVEWT